jgi:hypothetical protein
MRRVFVVVLPASLVFGLLGPVGAASVHHPRIHALSAAKSTNWSGYNQGTLSHGMTLFSQVGGDWVVPTATSHKSGQDEFSSTWIGIGGGCLNASCSATDNTLIQTGTEQDVDGQGKASYSAWWEIIPGPSIGISNPVSAGDSMHGDVRSTVPGAWTITLTNLTKGWKFTQTVPYSSSEATAEWILETPLIIGSNAGVAAMPTLSTTHFNNATVNNKVNNMGIPSAGLLASESIQLVQGGTVVATPSSPDASANGFNVCTYANSCPVPAD